MWSDVRTKCEAPSLQYYWYYINVRPIPVRGTRHCIVTSNHHYDTSFSEVVC